ncbi:MAG: 2Fe-2S iron-sulfur cluster-binding protein [Rhodocyclaceae bacterium]|nr:2Fe-2S iron-sulfur cluster-binding protein [Rhodocyclaceae bacterium]
MSQLLTLSRAAHLIGVPRGVLQKRIQNGELPAQDGMVSTEALLRLYPELNVEESGAFERITRIKEQSFGRRVRERMLPSQEILAQRLVEQSAELADLRRHLAQYHQLVVTLRERIDAAAAAGAAAPLQALARLLDDGLASVLGSVARPYSLAVMDDMLRLLSARVTLRPSGREFQVEGNETVLKAALKAGLAPAYGCGNGNCGLCKARVVSGSVRQTQHYDYPLSAAEQAQNYTLLCSHTAVGDLVIEALEANSPADIPEQQLTAKVKSIAPLDEQTLLLHLQTPRSQRLRFFAGQGVSLGIAGGTADFGGEYPIASCPCDDRNLLFHIPRDAEGGADEFAQRLFAGALRAGDPVNVRGPWGNFVLRKDSPRPILFACCDSGFAPVASLVEHALSVDAAESIALCWVVTRAGGHYAAKQCRAWAEALDDFRYLPRTAADAEAAAAALLDAAAGLPDLAACDIYLAGPRAFVAAARAALCAGGVPEDRLMAQAFDA